MKEIKLPYIELFAGNEKIVRIAKPKYISNAHKNIWTDYQADKAVGSYHYTDNGAKQLHTIVYRFIDFTTVLNKGFNYVRWQVLYKNAVRCGDSFVHSRLKTLSLVKGRNRAVAPRNAILPPPQEFEHLLPELSLMLDS